MLENQKSKQLVLLQVLIKIITKDKS